MVASLTRSNETGDIGFMSAPERLNVLITRARNGIVLIGNMETFMRSKKGRPTWHPFFDLLKAKGHLYDGLPVHCGKHPERTALLKEPSDFDKSCPDGGCTELWYVILLLGFWPFFPLLDIVIPTLFLFVQVPFLLASFWVVFSPFPSAILTYLQRRNAQMRHA